MTSFSLGERRRVRRSGDLRIAYQEARMYHPVGALQEGLNEVHPPATSHSHPSE